MNTMSEGCRVDGQQDVSPPKEMMVMMASGEGGRVRGARREFDCRQGPDEKAPEGGKGGREREEGGRAWDCGRVGGHVLCAALALGREARGWARGAQESPHNLTFPDAIREVFEQLFCLEVKCSYAAAERFKSELVNVEAAFRGAHGAEQYNEAGGVGRGAWSDWLACGA